MEFIRKIRNDKIFYLPEKVNPTFKVKVTFRVKGTAGLQYILLTIKKYPVPSLLNHMNSVTWIFGHFILKHTLFSCVFHDHHVI